MDEREKRWKKGRRRVITSHRPWAEPKLLGRPRDSTYLDPTNAKGNGDCNDNSRAAENTFKKYHRRKYRCRPITTWQDEKPHMDIYSARWAIANDGIRLHGSANDEVWCYEGRTYCIRPTECTCSMTIPYDKKRKIYILIRQNMWILWKKPGKISNYYL